MHDIADAPWIDLTSRQRSLWLGISATGDGRLFQVGAKFEVAKAIDLKLLQTAFSDVVRRHDALRLTMDLAQPRQRTARVSGAAVRFVDLSAEADPQSAAGSYIDQMFASAFNLDEGALVQLVVVSVGAERCWLVFRAHHIVSDAKSFSIIIRDVIETYDLLAAGVLAERPRSSYRQFQRADSSYCSSPRFERDREYWRTRLSDLPAALFSRRADGDGGTGRPVLRQEIEHGRFHGFLSQCAAQDVQAGNVLLAMSAWLLASMQRRDGLVLGVAYPGRTKNDQATVGMFSGVMPFPVNIPRDATLPALASDIAKAVRRDYLHHLFPVDDMRRNLTAEHRHRETLFDVIVSYMPLDVVDFDIEFGGEMIRLSPMRGSEANPLVIYVSELNTGRPVALEFAYNRRYLNDRQVAVIADGFNRLLDSFIDNPLALLCEADQPTGSIANAEAVPAATTEPLHEVRIVSTFTSIPIEAPLQFWLQRVGIPAALTSAGYNQIFQELLDPTSAVMRNRTGVNVVLVRLEDWLREHEIGSFPDGGAEFLTKVTDDFAAAIASAAQAVGIPFLLLVCAPSPDWDEGGAREALQNEVLTRLTAGLSGIAKLDVVTYRELRRLYPVDAEYDSTGDQLGHLPYTASAFAGMASFVARRCHLMLRSPIKVIVADCDNTLWDGVVGEDGPQGVRINESHRALQNRLVEAARCGVLVCLCSKNVEEDVAAVFQGRPDMILKWDHIVGHKINWKPKSENIDQLARELNLGLDSFLFLDDNPVEIAEVTAAHPGVIAIQVNTAGKGATRFDHLWPLDSRQVTAEDAKRADSYRQNLSRAREREKASDFGSFIASLDLKIQVDRTGKANLSRLEQLTERTNQFNINNIKRSAAALAEHDSAADSAVLALSVSDKFGDYGIVGLLAVKKEADDLLVTTFLMSCRVLGRGVEHRMIGEIGRLALEYGAGAIKIPVRVTARNLPVRQFLASVEGNHLGEGSDQLHVLDPRTAADCSFRPTEPTDVVEESVPARPSPRKTGCVDAKIWSETATAFASVVDIEKAIRASVVVSTRPERTSRLPKTPTECVLAELFCQALGLESMGADDDFFELGVYSLLAVQLVSRIRERLSSQLSIRTLFECSTIAKLAAAIDGQTGSGYRALVPLQIGDETPALFCCHPANGDAVCYMRLTKAIGTDQTVYGFEASGLSPGEALAPSLEAMARSYAKEMIAAQPNGPYHILGWSFGGGLAFEVARQIQAAGGTIGLLGFMDAAAPKVDESKPDQKGSIDEVDDKDLLKAVVRELNTMRKYAELEQLDEDSTTWQGAIDGYQAMGIVPKEYSVEEMRRKMRVYANCGIIFNRYRPSVISVPIVHFQAVFNSEEISFDWRPYTMSKIRTIWIRSNHYRMGFEPHTTLIGAHLRALVRGDKQALGWWRRWSLASSVDRLVGRFGFQGS